MEQRQARRERAGQGGKVSEREKLRVKRAEALKKRLSMKRKDGQRPMPRKMQKAMEARTANVKSMKVRLGCRDAPLAVSAHRGWCRAVPRLSHAPSRT